MKAPLSHNEPQRLEALARYQVLDTASEEIFDGITRLISHICGTPMALISLVDQDRQWFKSENGLGVQQTPIEMSICAHAILQPGLFVVPDTLKDARFADNPLVMAKNGLRFYAAAVLKSHEGYALGTLCVLDRKPRELTAEQSDALNTLAAAVMSLLELRRSHYEQLKVAHDFMNLASGIRGVATILLEEPSLSTSQQDDLQAILRAAERSVQLARRFKNPVSNATPALDVNVMVKEMTQMVSRFLRADLTLTTVLSPMSPMIPLDPTTFEQILLNIVLNARDAISGKGEIIISTEVHESTMRMSIRDTGHGIPATVLPHIFDRFYTTKQEGTGLGLATVRDIVQHAGGTVTVQSTVDVGTTFVITLPLVESFSLSPT